MRYEFIKSEKIDEKYLRIDSSFYLALGRRYFGFSNDLTYNNAIKYLERYKLKTIEDVSKDVFYGKRFKRTFVDSNHGYPYFAGKSMTQLFPTDPKYISKEVHSDRISELQIKEGWILITCSGTIGYPVLVGKEWNNFVVTHDLIRLIPDENKILKGYLLAFLGSELWQAQIRRHIHGSVVDHITPEQVKETYIPIISEQIMKKIHNEVIKATQRLTEVRNLLSFSSDTLVNNIIEDTRKL